MRYGCPILSYVTVLWQSHKQRVRVAEDKMMYKHHIFFWRLIVSLSCCQTDESHSKSHFKDSSAAWSTTVTANGCCKMCSKMDTNVDTTALNVFYSMRKTCKAVILLHFPSLYYTLHKHFDSLFWLGEKQWDHFTSSAAVMNAGAPQRCILSSLLYSHFTHGCIAKCDSDHIIKFEGRKTDRENSEYWWALFHSEVACVTYRVVKWK